MVVVIISVKDELVGVAVSTAELVELNAQDQ